MTVHEPRSSISINRLVGYMNPHLTPMFVAFKFTCRQHKYILRFTADICVAEKS